MRETINRTLFAIAIACFTWVPAMAADVRSEENDSRLLITDGQVNESAGAITLMSGSAFIAAKEPTDVNVDNLVVRLQRGADVFIQKSGGTICVRNLHDRHRGGVRATADGEHWLNVGVGQELLAGAASAPGSGRRDHIGRRSVKQLKLKGFDTVRLADISLQDNLVNEPTIHYALAHVQTPTQRRVREDLLKMTAICNMVTRAHGTFARTY